METPEKHPQHIQATRRFSTPGTDKRQESSTARWGRHAEIPRGSLRRIFCWAEIHGFYHELVEIHGFYHENW